LGLEKTVVEVRRPHREGILFILQRVQLVVSGQIGGYRQVYQQQPTAAKRESRQVLAVD
jgi:hypothetical protein